MTAFTSSPRGAHRSACADRRPTCACAGNELHCPIARQASGALGGLLRARFGAELILMAADDRRAERRRFRCTISSRRPRELVRPRDREPARRGPAHRIAGDVLLPGLALRAGDLRPVRHRAEGHPDPRPLVRHGFWPDRLFPAAQGRGATRRSSTTGRPFPFGQVGGEGVYEIPVGPVHAGVIEPGHFRFSVVGETIIDMKSRLYFTHKGTEKLFEGRRRPRACGWRSGSPATPRSATRSPTARRWRRSPGSKCPQRARYLRVVLLELERLYNHVGRLRDDRQRHRLRRRASPLLPHPRAAAAR